MISSRLNSQEKSRLHSTLQPKIVTAALARIYYTQPDGSSWSFSGQQGALAFVKNKNTGLCALRMVDIEGTRGVIWEQDVYDGLDLRRDERFRHTVILPRESMAVVIVFADEGEADALWKKVMNTRAKHEKRPKTKKSIANIRAISPPQPGSFLHLSHVGFDTVNGFTGKNIDPSWMNYLVLGDDVVA